MSTLHERLTDLDGWTIGDDGMAGPVNFARDYGQAIAALRAVVELHAPIQLVLAGTPDQFIRCPECPGGCDTITAIAEALGVEIGETPK